MTVKKYTLYKHDKEIGLVYSNDPDDILEIWSDLKSVTDGIETPIWYLKEKGYRAGIAKWGRENGTTGNN
jgi:hypothetical protein